MDLNAGLEGFEISVTFADKVQANNSGTVTNNTTTALTNVKYSVTDATKKEVSATPVADDITGNVIIPETVYIGEEPYTVTSIPENAFLDYNNITGVYIPGTVKTIGDNAFAECDLIMTIQLAEGVEIIESCAFMECYMLSGELVLPDSLKVVESGAFNMAGEESQFILTFGENLESIGASAFSTIGIANNKIVIPNKVKTIGSTAFAAVRSREIFVPKSVISIAVEAFGYCDYVTSFVVEDGNTKYHSAGNCLIETATGTLMQVFASSVVPTDGSIKIIGERAYSYVNVKSVNIPQSVVSIAEDAFLYNIYLESITVGTGNTKYYSAGNCLIEKTTERLILGCKNSVIPNGVKIIAKYAFYYVNIKRLVFPASVIRFEDFAVWFCDNLIEIVIEATTPPELGGFRGNIGDCPIYVPAESVDAYKAANGWKNEKDKIFAIGS